MKKIKSILTRPREEQMLWTMLALPIAFLPLIYSLTPNSFYESGIFQWSKVIEYYIELLSAVGSVFLGLIAILQTQKLQKLEENADNRANSCNIYLENSKLRYTDILLDKADAIQLRPDNMDEYKREWNHICFYLTNYSSAFLKDIELDFGGKKVSGKLTLAEGKTHQVLSFIPGEFTEYKDFLCKVTFTSCYNVKTYADFMIHIPVVDKSMDSGMNKCEIYAYNFYGTEQPK